MKVMEEVIPMNSFDKSMRLKGKVEEDRYFAKLDQDRVAALRARQQRSPIRAEPRASLKPTAGDRSPVASKRVKN